MKDPSYDHILDTNRKQPSIPTLRGIEPQIVQRYENLEKELKEIEKCETEYLKHPNMDTGHKKLTNLEPWTETLKDLRTTTDYPRR